MFDARALHEWLEVKTRFNAWIVERLTEYGFEEGSDFYRISGKSPSGRGRPRIDYLITIDMAKELAMIERTERGRQTRRYFIEMEKAAREMAHPEISVFRPIAAIPRSSGSLPHELSRRQPAVSAGPAWRQSIKPHSWLL